MRAYKREFLELSLELGVLRFGEFTLKSGRVSPYFFNSGLFNNGNSLANLGNYYAQAIYNSDVDFDMLFGPAYKGIPLVSTVAIALLKEYRLNVLFCFDRKEAKDHGEGGITNGAPLKGKVLITDDVISAGTSVNNSVKIIREFNAVAIGVAIALDRQERGLGDLSAVQEVEQQHEIKVISIITLDNLIEYLQGQTGMSEHIARINQYREQYGVDY